MSRALWTDHVVPRLTDVSLRNEEIGRLRARVCEGLTGDVLEIGFGSGLNMRFLPADVTHVSAVEPSEVGWRLSERRRARSSVPVDRAGLDGQHLALPDHSHDSALVTFSLCTIPDPASALLEVQRVLRPGGRLHLLEHGLAPDPGVRRWQHRLEPAQRRLAGGCHLTRDVAGLLRSGGWQPEWLEHPDLPGPKAARPWTYVTMGVATFD